jgi:NodT family efflux transporter outer membrane factor (OMF) lipoprotein
MRRISLAVVLLLAGCKVGPDYRQPMAETPPAFKELGDWKPVSPADLGDRGAWWSVFDDPVLDGLERQVEVSNQTLLADAAAYEQAVAVMAEARAQLFPTLSAAPSVTRSQGASSSLGGSGGGSVTRTTFAAEASVSWAPDLWGRVRRTISGDVAAAQASAADLANAKLSAQATLAIDYFEMRSADELKVLLDNTVSDYRRALVITTNQYNAGTAARSDVINAQTQLQGAIASDIAVAVTRGQLEHAIAVLIGRPPAAVSITPGRLAETVPVVPAGLPSELLERRPDIAAAERNAADQSEQIGVAIAAYYPTITLSPSFGFSASKLGMLFNTASEVWSLGASASETVFSGGERPAAVAAARAGYDQAVANYRQTVLVAFQQVEDQLVALHVLQQQLDAERLAVQLAKRAVDVTLNQYRAGTQPYTAVIIAENTLLADQQTALAVQQSLMVASVTLIEAVGGGWNSGDLPSEGSMQAAHPVFP